MAIVVDGTQITALGQIGGVEVQSVVVDGVEAWTANIPIFKNGVFYYAHTISSNATENMSNYMYTVSGSLEDGSRAYNLDIGSYPYSIPIHKYIYINISSISGDKNTVYVYSSNIMLGSSVLALGTNIIDISTNAPNFEGIYLEIQGRSQKTSSNPAITISSIYLTD